MHHATSARICGSSVVTTSAGRASNSATLSIFKPTVSSTIPPTLTSFSGGGTNLTLVGTSFGQTGATVLLSGQNCPVTSQIDDTIVCTLPPGQGEKEIQVRVADQVSDLFSWSYATPVITSISPLDSGPSARALLTIDGTSFGTGSAAVTIGGLDCLPKSVNTHTKIVCQIPNGVGTNKPVVVTVLGSASNSNYLFSYKAPQIVEVLPALGPTEGNIFLNISGTFFGFDGSFGGSVSVGGTSCPITVPALYTDSSIFCNLQPGSGSSQDIVVSVGGQSAIYAWGFQPPFISSFGNGAGPTDGGLSTSPFYLTIVGQNFGRISME